MNTIDRMHSPGTTSNGPPSFKIASRVPCTECSYSCENKEALYSHILSNHRRNIGSPQRIALPRPVSPILFPLEGFNLDKPYTFAEGVPAIVKQGELSSHSSPKKRKTPPKKTPRQPSKEQIDQWVAHILKAGPKVWIQHYQDTKRQRVSRSATASPVALWPANSPSPQSLTRRASFSTLNSIYPCSTSAFTATKPK